MKKRFFILFPLVLFILSLSFNFAFAQKPVDTEDGIPEEDGIYDVKGRPDLKVRVFVHKAKPPKPEELPVLVCGPDPDSSAVIPSAGWKLPDGEWTYYLNTSTAPYSIRASVETITNLAFDAWASSSSGKVTFRKVGNTMIDRKGFDRKNIVAWGRTSGTALGVTYTWYYPSTGLVAEVDTIMNKKVKWSWTSYATPACGDANTYDAQNILVHEIGHWMGLNDVYDAANYQNATMYGYGSKGEVKKDTLTTGDGLGLSAIYNP